MELIANTKIRDYKIVSQIGEGGMGKVFLADDLMLDRKVAIKMLDPLLLKDSLLIERFKQEAKLQASLLHSNIVALHNFFEENGNLFMVMEYAKGITLKELISKTGPIPEDRASNIFKQILEGVDFAHKRGIVHRDIKPSNIIVDENDNTKILDFGIAKILGDTGLTRTGTKMGTIHYMSPEQVRAEKDIDHRTDIYSLGVTFYQMLTGKLPYKVETDSDYQIMDEIVKGTIENPRKIYPHISDKSVSIVERMTKKNKVDRMFSCNELLLELNNYSTTNVESSVINVNEQREKKPTKNKSFVRNYKSGSNYKKENSEKDGRGILNKITLVLIAISVIFISIVGYNYIDRKNKEDERNEIKDAIMADMTNLGAMAQQHYRKPVALGGGGNSFNDYYSSKLSKWTIPNNLKKTQNASYEARVFKDYVILSGVSSYINGEGYWYVEAYVTPTDILFRRTELKK